MVKLVINIPCYNEEQTLPLVLRELPTSLPGIAVIEVQIVDDGSKDDTVSVARRMGVHRIIRHKKNLGLGTAFKTGVDAALAAGADIMVNTDGDGVFPADKIQLLILPILEGKADMVVGNRRPWEVKQYSPLKRFFQYFGNKLVRNLAGVRVPDMVCGFRAYSRETMLRLNVTTKFSYVLDVIVQAARKGMVIASLPITVKKETRKSRLFSNIFQHMYKSGVNIVRLFVLYEPFKTFLYLSMFFLVPAFILIGRFILLRFYMDYPGSLFLSALLAGVLLILGGLMLTLGALAELIAMNRRMIEEDLYLQRKYHFDG